ncbi:MAG: hypothetical protein HKN43_17455, partial [Rhodothermales bacterium]|nr:hypothetical protein [Rhodothermales bacterium]
MRNRILPIGITLFIAMLITVGVLWLNNQNDDSIAETPKLELSTNNPNDLSIFESKLIPKSENPGERFEHDFMLT